MKVLVTGGAGYIGSTTAKALELAGHTPVILDSLMTGPRVFVGCRIFYQGDVSDRHLLRRIVEEHPEIECTIHMAGRILVSESIEFPYDYYRDNVVKSIELFHQLVSLGKPRVLFSSSASMYAVDDPFEATEKSPLNPASPYARTKLAVELALGDMAAATELRALILRYFNPIGSDPGLETGAYARDPSHVLGQLIRASCGTTDAFTITGTKHPTRDGTGIRDYIHVWDLARSHVAAVEMFDHALAREATTSTIINIGSGEGLTVLELIAAFESVIGKRVRLREGPPRPGDAVGAFANVEKARDILGWTRSLTIEDAIASAVAWGQKRRKILGYA